MRKEMMSCVLGLLCLAQQGVAAEADHTADHQALRVLRDKVETTLNTGNIQELGACLAKEFVFITSDQTVLTNLTGVVAYWDGMLKNEASPITGMKTKFKADGLTQFLGTDTGYCRGTSRDVYTLRKGQKIAVINTWSVILVKEKDSWKISKAHVAVNFLDNPVLEGKKMSWFGRLGVWLGLRTLPGEVKE
jgi:ketosteroid isomerase-like protein